MGPRCMTRLKAARPNGNMDGMAPIAAKRLAGPRRISLVVGVARPPPNREVSARPSRVVGRPSSLVTVGPSASPKTSAAEIGTGPLGPQIGAADIA